MLKDHRHDFERVRRNKADQPLSHLGGTDNEHPEAPPMSVNAPPMQNPTMPTFCAPVALRYLAASHISPARVDVEVEVEVKVTVEVETGGTTWERRAVHGAWGDRQRMHAESQAQAPKNNVQGGLGKSIHYTRALTFSLWPVQVAHEVVRLLRSDPELAFVQVGHQAAIALM
jgi:hypothetical protein